MKSTPPYYLLMQAINSGVTSRQLMAFCYIAVNPNTSAVELSRACKISDHSAYTTISKLKKPGSIRGLKNPLIYYSGSKPAPNNQKCEGFAVTKEGATFYKLLTGKEALNA